jgi:hypothetical protein
MRTQLYMMSWYNRWSKKKGATVGASEAKRDF